MLHPMVRIARLILKRRQYLQLSQRQVARAVGCSQPYLAQVETGRRPISRRFAEKLETFFKVRSGSYTRGVVFRRGRPALARGTRRALREIRRARGAAPRPLWPLGRPKYPRDDRATGLDDPLENMTSHLGGEAVWEVEQLELLRPAGEHFWRVLQAVRHDSWSEKRLHVKVGLAGADLIAVNSGSLGCVLPCVNGQTGRDASRLARPAFIWQGDDISMAVFPQCCVGTRHAYLWPDNLVVAACRGRRVTGVVALDGKPFHQDREREKWRDKELGVPVLHLDADAVGTPGLTSKILAWVRGLFED